MLELVQTLLSLFDLEILLLYHLLCCQEFLLNLIVSLGLEITLQKQRLDSLILIAQLSLIFNLDRLQVDKFFLHVVMLVLVVLVIRTKLVDVVEGSIVLGLQVSMQRVQSI